MGCFPYVAIARVLDRTVVAVYNKAYMLGLCTRKGSAEYNRRLSRGLKGRRSNPAGEFKPGHRPWNKNKKGIHLSPKSEFKPGNLNGRALQLWVPVGTVRRRNDRGCLTDFIKVREDGAPRHRWMPLARFIYQRHHGAIPGGHVIVHVDGNSLNNVPDNLIAMSLPARFAWQKQIWPAIEVKRKKSAARSQRWRWSIYHAKKAKRREDDKLRTAS